MASDAAEEREEADGEKIESATAGTDDRTEEADDAVEETNTLEKSEGLQKSEQDKGKEEYNKGNYAEAVKAWSTSLKSVKYIMDKGFYKDSEEQLEEVQQIHQRINLNMAQASLKLEDWRKAIDYADTVLELDPHHTKALYRKAVAQIEMGDFKDGIATLDAMLKLEPDGPAAKALLAKAKRTELEADRKSRKAAKRMFANLEKDPRVPATSTERLIDTFWNAPDEAWNFIEDLRWRVFDLRRALFRQVQGFVTWPLHTCRRRCKAFVRGLRGSVEAVEVQRSKAD